MICHLLWFISGDVILLLFLAISISISCDIYFLLFHFHFLAFSLIPRRWNQMTSNRIPGRMIPCRLMNFQKANWTTTTKDGRLLLLAQSILSHCSSGMPCHFMGFWIKSKAVQVWSCRDYRLRLWSVSWLNTKVKTNDEFGSFPWFSWFPWFRWIR